MWINFSLIGPAQSIINAPMVPLEALFLTAKHVMSCIMIFFKCLILDSGIIALHKLDLMLKMELYISAKVYLLLLFTMFIISFKNGLRAELHYDTKITKIELEDKLHDIFACFENSSLPK